jgi:hypothetical protein
MPNTQQPGGSMIAPPAGGSPIAPPQTGQPQFFQDADGNIYNGNGDLVYDAGLGKMVGPESGAANAPSQSLPAAPEGLMMPPAPELAPEFNMSEPSKPVDNGYYSYGTPVNPSDVLASKKGGLAKMAEGGSPMQTNLNVPVSDKFHSNLPMVEGRTDYRNGSYVEGPGDGQSDDIPAMLADGEYVIDAETVAQLGNGSNKAGAKMLDQFRENIRAHKRSAPLHKIPPKSKSPLAYLKGAK